MTRDDFVDDKKTHLAVTRLVEEICEAAYWFGKSDDGKDIVAKYPDVKFVRFGDAGNIIRHQYWFVDYGRLWDDLHHGDDITALESVLEAELPFYRRSMGRRT